MDTGELYRYHDETAYRAVLITNAGRKWITGVVIAEQVRLIKIPVEDVDYMTPVTYTGRRRHVANAYLAAGKFLGISKGAKKALEALK